jgi:hypothetical protein
MEVHHHAHTARKKWTHYFWEFIMLFLAVFCGFMAENIREHKIEHKRAKQFAISLVNDLKADTTALQIAISYGNHKIKAVDSLVELIDQPFEKWKDTLIYKYEGLAGRIRPFSSNSGTYEQMKTSGSLRYFEQKLSDLLNQYDVQAKKTKVREEIHLEYAASLLNPLIFQILDARSVIQIQNGASPTYPLVFRKTDADMVALWINFATAVQSTQERTVVEYDLMLKKAKEIMVALKEEYHLK